MIGHDHRERLKRCSHLMKEGMIDILLLTKPANMVIAVGNCGLYTGPWGMRVEDTVLVGPEGPKILTGYPRQLKK